MTDNVKVKLLDLPCSIRAFTKKKDDVHTIILNARLSRETNMESLKHELEHIKYGHLDQEIDVQLVEYAFHDI